MVRKIQPVKGTRDFYPEDMAFRNWIFDKIRIVSHSFGYEEYEGPILEPEELYLAKTSKELIEKQAFVFSDKNNRKIVLRPEMTPTVSRMVSAKSYEIPVPIRWFSIGPRFRYETPQKGRGREFYQWDIDMFGIDTPEADAEIIAVAVEFFKALDLSPQDIVIKINDRKLMEMKFKILNIPKKNWLKLTSLIDKRDKMDNKKWDSSLKQFGLDKSQIKDLHNILHDYDFSFESERLTQLFSTLEDLGCQEYVQFDPNIVRGLLYYTSTVFEARDRGGELRSILGGGRYASLVEQYGGRALSGVGFALGDQVIEELLRRLGKMPSIKPKISDIMIAIVEEGAVRDALKVSVKLRKAQLNTEVYPDASARLDKQLDYANKKQIPFVIIFGPEEVEKEIVTVKKMETGVQKQFSLDQISRETLLF
jgi:histidyl-tRNA synthetase